MPIYGLVVTQTTSLTSQWMLCVCWLNSFVHIQNILTPCITRYSSGGRTWTIIVIRMMKELINDLNHWNPFIPTTHHDFCSMSFIIFFLSLHDLLHFSPYTILGRYQLIRKILITIVLQANFCNIFDTNLVTRCHSSFPGMKIIRFRKYFGIQHLLLLSNV